MRFYRKISIALILSLHFSVCTGGVLSTATVFAADFGSSLDSQMAELPQFLPDTLLCQSFTPNLNTSVDIEEPQSPSGCENGEFCFQNASQKNHDRGITISSPCTVVDATTLPNLVGTDEVHMSTRATHARAGPLYQRATLIAHILVKRE